MEEPPVIQTSATGAKVLLGRLGLYFSLAALCALGFLWLANPNFMDGSPSAKPT